MTERFRSNPLISAITLLYAGFTPDQIQEAESDVDVVGPPRESDEDTRRHFHRLTSLELPARVNVTRRRIAQHPTYNLQKLGIDWILWRRYMLLHRRRFIQFVGILGPRFYTDAPNATLNEVITSWWDHLQKVGDIFARMRNINNQSYRMFRDSYLIYKQGAPREGVHPSRGAGRKKKIRRRRKSKRKSKKKTKRRKKKTKRRR